jgi:hypothetical protein
MSMSDDVWKGRQRRLNLFTDKYLRGVGPIRPDGIDGPSTRKRIRQCQWWLGWLKTDGEWSPKLDRGLQHPRDPRVTSKATVARGIARRVEQRGYHYKSFLHPGVTTFDGVRVAKTAVPLLNWARHVGHGGQKWKGRLVSGYRDPAYSERLCFAMCGRPSCPGRCAGRSSNHSGQTAQRFAIDVSDYRRFGAVIAACPLRPKVKNSLGSRDPVHFSPSGR